jgi:cytoskeleton protein RodZ
MAPNAEDAGLPIGEALKRTRARHKLDIRTVEADTKVRAKYLRALENEEWEVLPGAAYAKGFLRTYAEYLGLDGDALVDEYRRTVESSLGPDQGFGFSEPVLEHHGRPGGEPRSGWRRRAPVLVALGAAAVIVLLILGLTGGSGHKERHHHPNGKGNHHHHASGGASGGGGQAVTLSLTTHDDMVVCLLPGHGRPLIDSQTLIAGAQEGPFPPADNYRLDLDSGGAVTLTMDGKPQRVHSKRPASFAIDSSGVRQIDFAGPNCP